MVEDVFEQNPDLNYLKNVKVHFLPLPKIRMLFGGYIIPIDRIFLAGDTYEPALIYALSHEYDHADYRKKNGILKTVYNMVFHRFEKIEDRAVRRGLFTLKKLSDSKPQITDFFETIRRYKICRNPIKRLAYKLYFQNLLEK